LQETTIKKQTRKEKKGKKKVKVQWKEYSCFLWRWGRRVLGQGGREF
jgi:hypothetical protein